MDPIADMLNKIGNAQKVGHKTVKLSFSKAKFELARMLEANGFVGGMERSGKGVKRFLEITLKYNDGRSAFGGFKKVSKPGRKMYVKNKDIRPVKQGFGKMIVSTSHGLMTGEDAKKNKLGGEIICEVW